MKVVLFLTLAASAFGQITLPNAVPMPTPEVQYLDQNGAPLAGAKLCTYAAGTTTPLKTYTDSTAGTENTNPIILDSAGRASVWVGPKLYKFVLRAGGDGTCSTGVVQWTQDNVADTTLYFTNYVKTVGTATLISYLNPATGAVQRTQQAKNNDVLSVKDFGAVGDGSTDDTTAINLALAWTTVSNCIYFPDGVYITTSALSSTHQVCLVGTAWRLKYMGGSLIPAVFSLIGGTLPRTGSSGYMEGSRIEGAIFDGQGAATNGLLFQAVVAAVLNFSRATNVVDAGFLCNWCQQTNAFLWQTSANTESFTTTPARGVVVDGGSSANVFVNVNVDHVSGNGIDLPYGINTTFLGGASEGNGGFGVNCTSAVSPFHQCFNNTFIEFDTEVNTSGDFYFGDGTFFNSILHCNGFSIPGITFDGNSHGNTVLGGMMGAGSIAGVSTRGNRLINVGVTAFGMQTIWTDLGSNHADPFFNQATGTVTPEVNNYHSDSLLANFTGGHQITFYTPSPTYAEMTVGMQDASHWIGFTQNASAVPWLIYPTAGFQFQSFTDYPRTGAAVPDGAIVNHKWCFGQFCTTPVYPFHFLSATVTTVVDQRGTGQGGANLHEWRGLVTDSSPLLSAVATDGAFIGPTGAGGTTFSVSGCGAAAATGGSTGGTFTVTTTGSCTATITMGDTQTAVHGWNCSANNVTTANLLRGVPNSVTTAKLIGTTVSGDTLSFSCGKY